MEKIEVTWQLALKIWWSFAWRSTLLSFIVGMVAAFPVGVIAGMVDAPKEVSAVLSGFIGLAVGLWMQIYVMKKILNKKYKTFSIALIREQ